MHWPFWNRLANAGLDTYFRVVGTHALYAYEAAGGVSFSSEITSTRDIDLLWDTRKRVVFSQRLAQDSPSMLAALQKVDKTFQIIEDQKYTAINKDGFEVDIIRRFVPEGDPHPIRLSDALDDFWVVQAKTCGRFGKRSRVLRNRGGRGWRHGQNDHDSSCSIRQL